MPHKLSVAIIHGMGDQTETSNGMIGMEDELKRKLDKALAGDGLSSDDVEFVRILWSEELSDRQQEYYDDMTNAVRVDWKAFRKFMINFLGDASAYRWVQKGSDSTYQHIHQLVLDGLSGLEGVGANGEPAPLVVMAHSLGAHIMSNYIYDIQSFIDTGNPDCVAIDVADLNSDFLMLKSTAGLITFGCNIPLFTFAVPQSGLRVIDPVGPDLPGPLKDAVKWHNYYDRDDILGYPLRPLGGVYAAPGLPLEDHQINAGGIVGGTPLSHSKYWTDNDLTNPSVAYLANLVRLAHAEGY